MKNIETSFIMLKVDVINNHKFNLDLYQEIIYNELKVNSKFYITLDESQIDFMWPERLNDYVSNRLLKKYMCYKRLPIYTLTGANAIKKTEIIKKYLRHKYQKSRYANCLHTPSTLKECEQQLQCMNGIYRLKQSNKAPIFLTNFFPELTIERLSVCVDLVYDRLKDINFYMEYNKNISKILNDSNIAFLQMKIDYDLDIIYVIKELYFHLHILGYSIEDIYLIAFGVDHIGKYPLFLADKTIINSLFGSLLKTKLTIEICDSTNMSFLSNYHN